MYRTAARRPALTGPSADTGLPAATSYTFRDFTLLPHRRLLMRQGQPVALGGRAFDLLRVLVESHHRIVEKDEILERVWEGRCVEESNIPVQMMRLRRLVGEDCVITVPQRGYQFTAVVQVQQLPSPDAALLPTEQAAAPRQMLASGHCPPDHGCLIGRGTEVDEALKLLLQAPSLVITGPVGVGKSAVAAAIARAWAKAGRPAAWLSADPNDDEGSAARRLQDLLQDLDALSGRANGPVPAGDVGAMVVLDNTDRWSPAVCELVRHRLAQESSLRVMSTCPGRSRGHADAVLRLSPLRLDAAPLTTSDGQSGQVHPRTGDACALDMLRRHDLRPDEQGAAGSLPSAAETSLCRLLDGRPGLLRVAARWAAMASAEQARAWLLKDPSMIAQAAATPETRTLLEALDASVAMLDDAARKAYRVLARPDKPANVNQMLRLLRRNGFAPAAALKALTDLMEQHLLRRLDPERSGSPPRLLMATPERWHALGRLQAGAEQSIRPIRMAPRHSSRPPVM